jgi:hypothetical protein
MNGKINTTLMVKSSSGDRVRKNELLRLLHVLDPRYYTRGIPGGATKIMASRPEKRCSRTRESQLTRALLRRYFALGFAQDGNAAY